MLKKLCIRNYALIEEVIMDFSNGMSVITGETGSGKSIMLGGLSLVLGERADLKLIKDSGKKCVVEAEFDLSNLSIKKFFEQNDLDYEVLSILRREINPAGKSRVFVNDTPVSLSVLKDLGEKLVDIHSQHQTISLNSSSEQLCVVDAIVNQSKLLEDYQIAYVNFSKCREELEDAKAVANQDKKDFDYFNFQLEELNQFDLENIDFEAIEEELNLLENADAIKHSLTNSLMLLSGGDSSVSGSILQLESSLSKIASSNNKLHEIAERVKSVSIEVSDVEDELNRVNDSLEFDPNKVEEYRGVVNGVNQLLQKHQVATTKQLIEIKRNLQSKVENLANLDFRLEELAIALTEKESKARHVGEKISKLRARAAAELEKRTQAILQQLAMPNAALKVELTEQFGLHSSGLDAIKFLFKTNKGGNFGPLGKIASGGELSRLMLAVKAVASEVKVMPTIILDEIDTGVSGAVADKVGDVMRMMSENMQVLSITHLPQIAGKGKEHFKVLKKVANNATTTHVEKLEPEARLLEIATMISGEQVSEAAMQNARELLN